MQSGAPVPDLERRLFSFKNPFKKAAAPATSARVPVPSPPPLPPIEKVSDSFSTETNAALASVKKPDTVSPPNSPTSIDNPLPPQTGASKAHRILGAAPGGVNPDTQSIGGVDPAADAESIDAPEFASRPPSSVSVQSL